MKKKKSPTLSSLKWLHPLKPTLFSLELGKRTRYGHPIGRKGMPVIYKGKKYISLAACARAVGMSESYIARAVGRRKK